MGVSIVETEMISSHIQVKSGLVTSLESFAAVLHGKKPGISIPLVLGNIS